jgi:hypothetical protein
LGEAPDLIVGKSVRNVNVPENILGMDFTESKRQQEGEYVQSFHLVLNKCSKLEKKVT